MNRTAILLLSVISMALLGACDSNRPLPGTRVCPEVATVAPGRNHTFQLCDGLVADSLIQWSTAGPGFMVQNRYHAPLVVTAPLSVIVQATPERWTGIKPGRAVVLLPAGSVPGIDSCAGPAQGHLPAPDEYVPTDSLPEVIHIVAPSYPDSARAHGVQGLVVVAALVCASGEVIDAYVLESIPELDDAAELALRQWIFRPAMTDGVPVAVWVVTQFRFSIHGPHGPRAIATLQ